MIAQNEAETVEKALASVYDHVDAIVVCSDPARGWSGEPITPDDTLDRARSLDRDRKIDFFLGDFCRYDRPMLNDTFQRQSAVRRLNEIRPGLDWVVQLDADEVFLDFPSFRATLGRLPPWTRGVYWRWIQLFNRLDDGRYLVIVDDTGKPVLEPFPLAHRPGVTLSSSRHVRQPISSSLVNRLLLLEYRVLTRDAAHPVLHYSYAKSAARIREKLRTWSHSAEFDTDAFFELWERSRTDWASLRYFHPIFPSAWPALKPFHLEDLHESQVGRNRTEGLRK